MAVLHSFTDGRLDVVGDAANDNVLISTMEVGGIHKVTVNGEQVGSGVDAAAVTSIVVDAGAGNDSVNLSGVTPIRFTGLADGQITVRGGTGNDTLTGSPFGDNLFGGDNNDTLSGGGGPDILDGGSHSNVYAFAGNADLGSVTIVQPQSGHVTTLQFANLGGGITIDLSMTTPQVVRQGQLTLTLSDGMGIANVQGTAYADVILGNARGNSLMGNGGNDFIWGRDGNDWLDGGAGDDNLRGGNGNDTLLGKGGNDSLYGDAGADSLNGNEGNDHLVGDEGNDTYILGAYGTKTISEAPDAGSDTFDVSSFTLTAPLNLDSTAVQTVANSLSVRLTSPAEAVDLVRAGKKNDSNMHDVYTVPGLDGTTTMVTFTYRSASAAYENPIFVYEVAADGITVKEDTVPVELFTGNVTIPNTTKPLPYPAGTKLSFFIKQDGTGPEIYAIPHWPNLDYQPHPTNPALPPVKGDHVSTFEVRPGEIQYEWEDLFQDLPNPRGFIYDGDFNDLVMSVKAAELDYHLVDLDVDSDNTGSPVDRSLAEEQIEESRTLPGKIVAVGGARATMVVEWTEGTTATLAIASGADRVRVWTNAEGGEVVLSASAPTIEMSVGVPAGNGKLFVLYFIEALAPSESVADIAFTLTPQGEPVDSPLIDTVRATASTLDLQLYVSATNAMGEVAYSPLTEYLEDQHGGIVWRNSDFSRGIEAPGTEQTEMGLTRYVSDYEDTAAIDPAYALEFTRAKATFSPGLQLAFDFVFSFDPGKLILWTQEDWGGFEKVVGGPEGWWKIPNGALVQAKPGNVTDTTIEFWIEGLESTGRDLHLMEFAAVEKAESSSQFLADSAAYRVVDVGVAVDGNRDGEIDFGDSYDRQLTFWLNSDRDIVTNNWLAPDYETENAAFPIADSTDNVIALKRDLEDFAAIHFVTDEALLEMFPAPENGSVGTRPTYRYDARLDSQSTMLRLFQDDPDAKPTDHVLDADTVSGLVGSLSDAQTVGADGNRITSIETASPGRSRHLFEAFGAGDSTTFEYTVTITYPMAYGEAGPALTTTRTHVLNLDLRPIEEFYTRVEVPYVNSSGQDIRFAAYSPSDDGVPHFADVGSPRNTATTGGSFFLSGPDTAVFVHGWNMTDGTNGNATDWKKAFAETAFKRLYWQGFRGNFQSFDWPTFSDSEGPVQGDPLLESSNFSYNASEFQAFRSGQSLRNVLAGLGSTGPVHLLAHSMGNVVAAEALRQWAGNPGNGELVTSYVAMQGALSAGAYGDSAADAIPAPGSTTDLYLNWPTGAAGAGSQFYMEGTKGAAGKWINMFNPVDIATSSHAKGWGANNRIKPFAGNIWRDVLFASSEITAPRFTYYIDSEGRYVRSYANELGLPIDEGVVDLTPGLIGPDSQPGPSAYEIIAFMAKANSMPIGTKIVDFFGNNNFDVNDFGLPELYRDKWSGHSFQFHFDAAMTSPFWKKVIETTGMATVVRTGV